MSDGDYGSVRVNQNDIVLMGSDGISDNMSDAKIKDLVCTHYFTGYDAKEIARMLAAAAIRANIKPDDTTVIVAYVQ